MPLDFQSISAIIFLILLSVYVYLNRKKLTTHGYFPFFYFSMYKTEFGLKFMDSVAKKFRKTVRFLGYAGIVIGFLGMILLSFSLIENIFSLLTTPDAQPGVGLVLPFHVKGAFFVPFFYWIISIFIIALVHEYAHGVVARAHNIKVKSSGFAFLAIIVPIIPAAFVEPDEKALRKRPHKEQLSVFAAGPLANIILAFIVLGLMVFVLAPIVESMLEFNGVEITGFIEGDYPAEASGITPGEVVQEINGEKVETLVDFQDILSGKDPGTEINLKTNKSTYNIVLAKNPEDETRSYLGVYVQQDSGLKESVQDTFGGFIPAVVLWIFGLFRWLVILNLGIGLFNLVPIGPIDGGRMLQLVSQRFFGVKRGNKIWYYISMLFLFLVIANIVFAFL